MLALLDQIHEPFVADEAEALMARKAADRLKGVVDANESVNITVDGHGDHRITVPLPPRAVELIHRVLEAMANRTPMSLIPHDAELTTQQAADYLNVSRPYLVARLDAGEIRFRKVGSHRRVRFADLFDYENRARAKQKQALAELNDEARRLGLE